MSFLRSLYARLTSPTARRRVVSAWGRFTGAVLFGLKALPVLLICALIIQYVRERIVIKPFSVTRTLSDAGITDAVAAEELRQRIYAIYQRATLNDRAGSGIALAPELPDITVPTTGLSVGTIFDVVAAVLPWNTRTTISGAFTDESGKLRLTVLVNGKRVYPQGSGPSPPSADALLDDAADAVVENTRPLSRAFDLLGRRRERDAERFLTGMIDRSPKPDRDLAEAYQLRGIILYDEHKFDRACAQFVKSLQISPNRGETHRSLSILLASEGQLERATDEAQDAVVLTSGRDSWSYYELGNRYYAQRRWSDAEAAYSRAIDLWFEEPFAHDALGQVRRQQADLEGAVSEFDVAIALNNAFAKAFVDRGEVFIQEHRLPEAKADFLAAASLDGSLAEADDGLGEIYFMKRQYDLAGSEFRRALHADVSDTYASSALEQSLLHAPAAANPQSRAVVRSSFDVATACRGAHPMQDVALAATLRDVSAMTCRQAMLRVAARDPLPAPCLADPPDNSMFHAVSTWRTLPSRTMFYSFTFGDVLARHAGWMLIVIAGLIVLVLLWRRMQTARR